jgi:hypothetical protein
VEAGECKFDETAADRCVSAIRAMSCDPDLGGDVHSWLLAADLIGECAGVFTCS